MKVLLVGGNFKLRKSNTKVSSGIVGKLGNCLREHLTEDKRKELHDATYHFKETSESEFLESELEEIEVKVVNGGTVDELNALDLEPYNLIIWMANVDNGQPKKYPVKPKGAVMIISKVLREDRTELDAISRIFGMHANAVIAIKIDSQIVNGHARAEALKDVGVTEAVVETKPLFTFNLLDALGNKWIETVGVQELASAILAFTKWNSESQRVGTVRVQPDDLAEVVELNKIVADKFEKVKSRYFGNVSTRCMKMSPTTRGNGVIFVSQRNVSKQRLTTDEMIPVMQKSFNDNNDTAIRYFGKDKPSVDTPIQLFLYKVFPNMNYMIHGHAYIKDAEFTEHYYPCGDMREVEGIISLITLTGYEAVPDGYGCLNLKNHGFLIYANTLEGLKQVVNEVELIEREVGEKL